MKIQALSVSLAALAACNGAPDPQLPVPVADVAEIEQVSDEVPSLTVMNTNEQVAWSINDLAGRLNMEPANVRVSVVRPVLWRSGAIGCPEPGMSYTQALVDGLWITLAVGETEYRYHAKTGGKLFYCPAARAEPPASGAGAD